MLWVTAVQPFQVGHLFGKLAGDFTVRIKIGCIQRMACRAQLRFFDMGTFHWDKSGYTLHDHS